ncbi:MAG TPA: DUF6152 family protein [Gammaproteobacteria bacterium]|nr:DUF6152 family protein [Gammaproteobacteria bacterium]
MNGRSAGLALIGAALLSSPLAAHHSWSRYDGEHIIELTGTITSIEWASPHVVMHFTVAGDSGEPTAWTMEMDPPTLLNRYGLRHDTLAAGMRVKLIGVPARSGAAMMRAVMIELADGTVYRVSSRV